MAFKPRNAYYLRISTDIVLPLFLYLDDRHMDWMSDVVLQHVLADLRPLIVPKLQTEKDVHFGPGAVPGNNRGTVEVHRGETYQFAYFFRRTEPHTVLLKSRYFVTAPLRPKVVPKLASPRLADQNPQKKRSITRVTGEPSKRKRARTRRKAKKIQNTHDEDEWSVEVGEEDMDDTDPILRGHDDDDVEDMEQDVAMGCLHPRTGERSSGDTDVSNPVVKDGEVVAWDTSDQPSPISNTGDIELAAEGEEEKPKPLLKVKYQSSHISGHCLCVVVEPWPPLSAEARPQSVGPNRSRQRGHLERSSAHSTGSATERAKTPLFYPDSEHDGAPSEVPLIREKTLPPVPLFRDALSCAEDNDYSDNNLMSFSQTLNAAGHMHAIAAEDDDDMEGTVLFGDADEVRELF